MQVLGDRAQRIALAAHLEHMADLLITRTLAHLAAEAGTLGAHPGDEVAITLDLALATAMPDLTGSRIRSRSNSARPAMMVRISLPLGVARSKLSRSGQ
jgi:hypothetical protein